MVNLSLTPTTDNNSAYIKPVPNPDNKPSWNKTWSAQMEYNYGQDDLFFRCDHE